MTRTSLTVDECAALLVEWLRRHCNSASTKATAKSIGYRYSIFSPQRKLHLVEELLFLYISLAMFVANSAPSTQPFVKPIVDRFLKDVRLGALAILAKDDPEFPERYGLRLNTYVKDLQSEGAALSVSGDFLVYAFGSQDARLKLGPSLAMVATVSAALQSLLQLLGEFHMHGSDA